MRKALGVVETDNVALIRALLWAIELVDEVEYLIKGLPDRNHDLYLHAMPNVRNFLVGCTINQGFEQYKTQHLRPEWISPVMFCAEALGRLRNEEAASAEDLARLTTEVDELYQSVFESSLPPDLKSLILEQLETIRRSVHEYRIKGIYVLRRALATTVGEVVLHGDEIRQAREGASGQIIERFMKVISILDKIVSVSTKTKSLFGPLLKYLPALSEHYQKH
jgi:hypothetical protein